MKKYSFSPASERFVIPLESSSLDEFEKISHLTNVKRSEGMQIVIVQGLGFVGAINAAVIADTVENKKSKYFVIGVDLPTSKSYWKIELINRGECPFKSQDPEVDEVYQRVVLDNQNFIATWINQVYSLADIVVVDINLDVKKNEIGDASNSDVLIEPFIKAIQTIGKYIKPDASLLIETTVPPGTIEKIIKPILEESFQTRDIDPSINPPLIAHSYERVMPGKDYVKSIRNIWRTYSGINEKSEILAKEFLESIGNTEDYPLWRLDRPHASELAKILENSYRAMNIAFIQEWTLFAEDIGLNLFDIIESIRVRKGTHDNMMLPGFGVGGYCLTKDSILAHWASQKLFNRKEGLNFSMEAINVNDTMPLHTFNLIKNSVHDLENKKILVLGASYRKDVDDSRNSPTVLLYDKLKLEGADVTIHDPYVRQIYQRSDIKVINDLHLVPNMMDVLVLVVNHQMYLNLSPDELASKLDWNGLIVDAFNILNDEKIRTLLSMNIIVLGVGKGHINSL